MPPILSFLVAMLLCLGIGAPPAGKLRFAAPGRKRKDKDNCFIVKYRPTATRSRRRQLFDLTEGSDSELFNNTGSFVKCSCRLSQIEQLQDDDDIDYIEEDVAVYGDATQNTGTQYWNLDRVDQASLPLDQTFNYQYTGQGVPIYILDTGVNGAHEEFAGRMGRGVDIIGSGTVDPNTDCHGHGTHAAGTAAGTRSGIAKLATVVSVRVMGCNSGGTSSTVIAGINWVMTQPRGILSMSIGGGFSQATNDAVAAAVAKNYIVVAAAGNENTDACTKSPASAPDAITVGATSRTDSRSTYSNYGTCVDIFAPGDSIYSALNTNNIGYTTMSGTSMATPLVAGAAAAYLSANPSLTPVQMWQVLKNAATVGVVTNLMGSPNLLLRSSGILSPISPSISVSPLRANPSPNPVSPSPRSAGGATGVDQSAYVTAHNTLRCQHASPNLVWSDTVAASAANWATTCLFQHTGGQYGENLYSGTRQPTAASVVQLWYNEISSYNFNMPGYSSAVGHFTQVVWKSSLRVGCAMCQGSNGWYNVMCMYDPPGNIVGGTSFQNNVLPISRTAAECTGLPANSPPQSPIPSPTAQAGPPALSPPRSPIPSPTVQTGPKNDLCVGALPLPCNSVVSGSTQYATRNGSPVTCGTTHTSPEVWYYIDMPASGTILLSMCNAATFDTKLTLWSGSCSATDLSTLRCVGGADDTLGCGVTTILSRAVTAGRYLVMVHGYQTNTGNFNLGLTCSVATAIFAAGDQSSIPSDSPMPPSNPVASPPSSIPRNSPLPAPAPTSSTVRSVQDNDVGSHQARPESSNLLPAVYGLIASTSVLFGFVVGVGLVACLVWRHRWAKATPLSNNLDSDSHRASDASLDAQGDLEADEMLGNQPLLSYDGGNNMQHGRDQKARSTQVPLQKGSFKASRHSSGAFVPPQNSMIYTGMSQYRISPRRNSRSPEAISSVMIVRGDSPHHEQEKSM